MACFNERMADAYSGYTTWVRLMNKSVQDMLFVQDSHYEELRTLDKTGAIRSASVHQKFISGRYFEAMVEALERGFWRYDRLRNTDLDYFASMETEVPEDVLRACVLTMMRLRGYTSSLVYSLAPAGIAPAHHTRYLKLMSLLDTNMHCWLADTNRLELEFSLNRIFAELEGLASTRIRVRQDFPNAVYHPGPSGGGHWEAVMSGNEALCKIVAMLPDFCVGERTRRALARMSAVRSIHELHIV